MTDRSITTAGVRGRATAYQLAEVNPREALKVARSISHPWYRCQALAKVAEVWGTKRQKMDVLEEALAAAQEQSEINRIVTVSSWPLAVMRRVDLEAVAAHLRRLVSLAEREPHTLRRADALAHLAGAARNEPSLLAVIGPSWVNALRHGRGWRIDRLIRDAVELLGASMPEVTEQLIEHHGEGRHKRAFLQRLSEK